MIVRDFALVTAEVTAQRCECMRCRFTAMITVDITEDSCRRVDRLCWLHWRNLVSYCEHGGTCVRFDDQACAAGQGELMILGACAMTWRFWRCAERTPRPDSADRNCLGRPVALSTGWDTR